MKFYECLTCKHINGVWRLHCQVCGTIPAQYHIPGVNYNIIPAIGCSRVDEQIIIKIRLQTVELDYYAGA
jgi:hypothetical protein